MRKWIWGCAIVLAMFAAGYGGVVGFSAVREVVRDFRYTERVTWDEAELNAVLTAKLEFENNTDKQVVVSDFQTTCGCILIGTQHGRTADIDVPVHILK